MGGCSPIHSNLGFHKETGSRREAAASGSPPHAQQSRTTLFTTLSMRQQLRPPFRWPQLSHARCCACVFSKTMYLDRQRYTVFWPYTICRPNTKTKRSRTRVHACTRHTRRLFFWDVSIRNSLRSNNIVTWTVDQKSLRTAVLTLIDDAAVAAAAAAHVVF